MTTTEVVDQYGRVVACQWFAKCDNMADNLVFHPVLGPVPTCERCRNTLGLEVMS